MPLAIRPGGIRIHYDIFEPVGPSCGDVVFVQGLGLSSRFWFDLPRDAASDADHPYRVITLDNRGAGRSDKPSGPYFMSDLADDMLAVFDAAGAKEATVVGISLGGMIALNAAVRHPERIHAMVLMATTPGLPHGSLPSAQAMAALLYTPFVKRGSRSRLVDRLLLPEAELDRAAELFRKWPAAFKQDPLTPAAFFSQLAAATTHSVGFQLSQIRCPTVVIAGEEDILIPPSNSRVIARGIPNSVLEILPGVGHAIPVLDEDVVKRALRTLDRDRWSTR